MACALVPFLVENQAGGFSEPWEREKITAATN